jgi:hypothetical protein
MAILFIIKNYNTTFILNDSSCFIQVDKQLGQIKRKYGIGGKTVPAQKKFPVRKLIGELMV